MTDLKQPVSRRICLPGRGRFVVTMTAEGVEIRGLRKQLKATVSYEALARMGLEASGRCLSEKEWADPLDTLTRLGTIRAARKRRRLMKGDV